MDDLRLSKNIMMIGIALVIGYFTGKWIHTPVNAWEIAKDNRGIERLIIESRDKKRAVLYRVSSSNSYHGNKEFVSGKDINPHLNSIWRKNYKEYYKEEPSHEGYNLETKWER